MTASVLSPRQSSFSCSDYDCTAPKLDSGRKFENSRFFQSSSKFQISPKLFRKRPREVSCSGLRRFDERIPTSKPAILKEAKRRKIEIQVKGLKFPKLMRRNVSMVIDENQVQAGLVRRILNQEAASLKLTGAALVYYRLLSESTDIHGAGPKHCPLCKSSFETKSRRMRSQIKFLISYAADSISKRSKEALLKKLKGKQRVSFKMSEVVMGILKTWLETGELVGRDFIDEVENLKEVKLGKVEALKLMKLQLLKTNKCGICESKVDNSSLVSSVISIDKLLANSKY